MGFDRRPVVCADIDVHADDLSILRPAAGRVQFQQ